MGAVFGYRYFATADVRQIESIAVLPFENASGNADLDYLSDGVSESVIDRLSQLPQLKVIARSSSFRYRGQNLNLQEIAEALDVQAIVTGRVLQRGNGYIIRVDLTDVRENKQLWGENFNRQVSDIQILQSDIAREIAENLSLRLSGAQTRQLAKQGTTNPEAYELMLKGRFWLNKAGIDNFIKAVEYYEQAVTVDPGYALAHAELSDAYRFIYSGTIQDRKQRRIKAAAAARNALNLDDNLAEAHIAEAGIMRDSWEWQKAESEYKRAIELNPNISAARGGYAIYLSLMARHDEAIDEIRRAREISPLSLIQTSGAGSIFLYARRYDEALEAMNKRLELDRTLPLPVGRIGEIYEAKGMNSEAILSYQESVRLRGNPFNRESARLGAIYAKMGERTKAEEILQLLESGAEQVVPTNLALVYEALGRRDEAFVQLEKAFDDRDPGLPFMNIDPAFDSMRSDPRFKDLLRRMGLPK